MATSNENGLVNRFFVSLGNMLKHVVKAPERFSGKNFGVSV